MSAKCSDCTIQVSPKIGETESAAAHLFLFVLIGHCVVESSFLVSGNDSTTCKVMFLLLIISLLYKAMLLKTRRGKKFVLFISHHKAGAGTLARWLEMRSVHLVHNCAELMIDNTQCSTP